VIARTALGVPPPRRVARQARRALHTSLTLGVALLVAGGCAGETSDPRGGETGGSEAATTVGSRAAVPRTADPVARGLPEGTFPRVQRLADGVYSYEQLRGAGDERFTTVSLFVVTSEGVLVADGQGSPEETRRMLDAIAEVTDQPVTHLVVSSDHGDHTGGNTAFPAGIEVFAHPTSADRLEAAAAGAREAGRPVPPTATVRVSDRHVLSLGEKEIHLRFLGRAHTGGDLVVHLPAEGVLFMSEAYLNRVFPAMRSAYPSEWVEMIERAQALDVEIYVPGHGFVEAPAVLREELERYRQAVVAVIEEAGRLYDEGVPLEEAMEVADFGELDAWSLRESQGPTAIRRVYAELEGELGPAPGVS